MVVEARRLTTKGNEEEKGEGEEEEEVFESALFKSRPEHKLSAVR
jgi:hypothetical protein